VFSSELMIVGSGLRNERFPLLKSIVVNVALFPLLNDKK
jgi:hypothetical protein